MEMKHKPLLPTCKPKNGYKLQTHCYQPESQKRRKPKPNFVNPEANKYCTKAKTNYCQAQCKNNENKSKPQNQSGCVGSGKLKNNAVLSLVMLKSNSKPILLI